MPKGLAIQRLINVQLNLTPLPAQNINFDTCLIVGDSPVIDTGERIRIYDSLGDVASDFGEDAPEYDAAELFFSQIPSPPQLFVGRWAHTATSGSLVGGPLTESQQALSLWTAVTAGSFKIAVDGGVATAVQNINLSGVTNMNGVASLIEAAIQLLAGAYAAVTCVWNGEQFIFGSGTTGVTSQVGALTVNSTGTDISGMLMCTAATLERMVTGGVAESALAAVIALDAISQPQWYALAMASVNVVDSDHLGIAAFIEGSSPQQPHIYGITTAEASALSPTDNASIGFQLRSLGYRRSFVQYSTSSPYAAVSLLSRGCTVNFGQQASVITFMWKQEPGVVAEGLNATQANALDFNNYDYFAYYNNNTAIVTNGKVANGDFIDNTWDLDWLVNQIQNNVWNLMYTSPGKVPQTDPGMHMISNVIEAACVAAVNNGTLAPGTWTVGGFGQIQQGDYLSKGYYIYQPPLASQSDADRAARKSVPFQVAVKLAGAVHSVAIAVSVNR